MNTLTTTSAPIETGSRTRRSLLMESVEGVGIALGLVSMVYLVTLALGEPLLVAGANGTVSEVAFGNIFGMTVLGGAIGLTLAYVLGRWARRPRATFLAICVLAVAGYAVVPFMAAETVSTAIWLNVFHIAVAIPIVGILGRRMPRTRS